MGISIEVDNTTFATEVLKNSHKKPILVDFYATWCGPCKMLKPILEKLVQEYDFILAKVDVDHNPELAQTYGVEGVPDVKIVTQGEVKPGFVGVLSEPKLRNFLGELNLKSELETELETLRNLTKSGELKQAKNLLDQLFQKYPRNISLIIEAAKFLVSLNRLEEAQKLIETIGENNREFYPQIQAVKGLIHFKQEVENPGDSELDKMYAQACSLTLSANYEEALKLFLDIVTRNRKYKNDGARKAMLAIFNILGDDNSTSKEYRKQLLLNLY
ncbi:MAG: tetratricopeptide repeat protein [Okeania sp. SIO1H4]|uniref:Co-chaperone YbbN n=2 Tax=Okeania TaxID=1458928 RepID=A0A3N6PYD1_9CYAN|nr:tetratricopeptide repeat protein [Okeania sp. SIO1H4]NES89947.1 tetratricopeptide repeat protein [Okeania sp. SIO2B9]NET18903.1 tetratricopeptide repeat protein [Okeania sp. SIO1H5]NET76399.1 tetratricopeptide repeat protein [Okeania sp. SIO1F9]NET93388.1 tetratricopeptide repeat protein [Okeania sp. SIO1H2]RQH48246.1 co-chaperone YbbN [Okeania hirsuta]